MPLWLTGTIIGRDILLLVGLLVIHLMVGKFTVRPRILGKVATVLQMIVVLWVMLKWQPQWLHGLDHWGRAFAPAFRDCSMSGTAAGS